MRWRSNECQDFFQFVQAVQVEVGVTTMVSRWHSNTFNHVKEIKLLKCNRLINIAGFRIIKIIFRQSSLRKLVPSYSVSIPYSHMAVNICGLNSRKTSLNIHRWALKKHNYTIETRRKPNSIPLYQVLDVAISSYRAFVWHLFFCTWIFYLHHPTIAAPRREPNTSDK